MTFERTWVSIEKTDDEQVVVRTKPRQDDDDDPPRKYRFHRVQAAADAGLEVVQACEYVTAHVCKFLEKEIGVDAVIVPARIDPEEQTVLMTHAA